MHKIISPLQAAFVPQRSMHDDNSIMTHEILRHISLYRGSKHYIAIKIDKEKAFDRVEWPLLFETMKCLGFEASLIQWIISVSPRYHTQLSLMGVPSALLSPLEEYGKVIHCHPSFSL